jgi:hypothetical protein
MTQHRLLAKYGGKVHGNAGGGMSKLLRGLQGSGEFGWPERVNVFRGVFANMRLMRLKIDAINCLLSIGCCRSPCDQPSIAHHQGNSCKGIQEDRRQTSHYVPRRTAMRLHRVLRSSASRQVENFTMPSKNQKQPDQSRIVASLASECHLPIGEMATLYEHERAELAVGAHITKYLHIFATRNVLKLLRKRRLERRSPAPSALAWAGA